MKNCRTLLHLFVQLITKLKLSTEHSTTCDSRTQIELYEMMLSYDNLGAATFSEKATDPPPADYNPRIGAWARVMRRAHA